MVLCWSSLLQKLRQSWENIEQKKSTGVATDYMYVCIYVCALHSGGTPVIIALFIIGDELNNSCYFEYAHVQLNLCTWCMYIFVTYTHVHISERDSMVRGRSVRR